MSAGLVRLVTGLPKMRYRQNSVFLPLTIVCVILAYAFNSAKAAWEGGFFSDEVVPVEVKSRKGSVTVSMPCPPVVVI